jgi:hypothetical protein
MIDYLLKFSSKKTALIFAANHGLTIYDHTYDRHILNPHTHDYSIIEIGRHDNSYWLALRIMHQNFQLPDTASLKKAIVWSSISGCPRPQKDPKIPNVTWS